MVDVNISLFQAIFSLSGQNDFLDNLMVFITNYFIYLPYLLVILIHLYKQGRDRRMVLTVFLSYALSLIIIKIIRIFIDEARPFTILPITPLVSNVGVASFPSIHSSTTAVVTFVYLIYKSRWAWPFLANMLLVGFSRIYVGVHYPLDILGGFAVGLLSAFVAKLLVGQTMKTAPFFWKKLGW